MLLYLLFLYFIIIGYYTVYCTTCTRKGLERVHNLKSHIGLASSNMTFQATSPNIYIPVLSGKMYNNLLEILPIVRVSSLLWNNVSKRCTLVFAIK